MKPLKMFVPERAEIGEIISFSPNTSSGKGIMKTYTRHEIHELVKAHAEKLEYWRSEDYEWHYDADCIYFWPDGEITMDGKDFDSPDITFQEISWQDFLKLTPGDVEVKSIPEMIADHDHPTTDRNEKAWELIKELKNALEYYSEYLDYNRLIKAADEFLKQAGNK